MTQYWLRITTLPVLFSMISLAQVEIPEGTKIRIRLEQTISSATAEEGQPVQLAVTEEVKVNDTVVFVQNANVAGTIVSAMPKRRMGRTGKLDFSVDKVTAIDGETIAVRYSPIKKEGGSHAVLTGVITAGVAIVFWPAAPFMLLMKGKDISLTKGMVFDVFTDTKHMLKPKGVAATATLGNANTVNFTSEPSGSDITIDGKFVGSTPSILVLTPGEHVVKVTKGNLAWEKTLTVNPASSVSVNAVLVEKTKP